MRGGGVWVLGEQRGGAIHSVSHELIAWGRSLADDLGTTLTCVIAGDAVSKQADVLVAYGADVVRCLDHPLLRDFRTDRYARCIETLIRAHEPSILLAGATTLGRTLMPVLAARLHTGLTADCTELTIQDGLLMQTRPAIGGNVMATIVTREHRPQMATVRPKSRRPSPPDATRAGELVIEAIDETLLAAQVTRLGFEPDLTRGSSLADADLIVAGGRGLGSGKRFTELFELANLLGGIVGASRFAVDLGWVPYAHQVGLSGKSVSPATYIALGISGSPNHLAGMASAERIIAVNSDPEAAIFGVADVGIVADLAEFLPAWLDRLRARARKDGESRG